MKVIAYDRHLDPEEMRRLDLEPISFDELLETSDYISIHTPKCDNAINLIHKDTIAKMKRGAMLISCARGGIIHNDPDRKRG